MVQDRALASSRLKLRLGMSSANARPVVDSMAGSMPALAKYSRVADPSPRVMSHLNGPGIGRAGGSASTGPHQTWTACMRPSDIWTGSVRMTFLVFGVMLASPVPVLTVSTIAV